MASVSRWRELSTESRYSELIFAHPRGLCRCHPAGLLLWLPGGQHWILVVVTVEPQSMCVPRVGRGEDELARGGLSHNDEDLLLNGKTDLPSFLGDNSW